MSEIMSRIGEKHITNEGYEIEVTEYFGWRKCTIRFNDGTTLHNRQYGDIKLGKISNPKHRTVCGIGFLGVGKYSSGVYIKHFESWENMIKRGHDSIYKRKQPTYKGVTVCEEWHNFQNFAEWFEEIYNPETMQGWQLDKDILVKGNKIYSPNTCCFVPYEVNQLFTKCNKIRGNFPIGVSLTAEGNYRAALRAYKSKKHLGTYPTPELAFQAYKKAKENYIKEVANRWKDRLSEKTYQAMYNYKVEITD